jgi:hypothetical protein
MHGLIFPLLLEKLTPKLNARPWAFATDQRASANVQRDSKAVPASVFRVRKQMGRFVVAMAVAIACSCSLKRQL